MNTCGDRNCIFERRTAHSRPRCACTRGMSPVVMSNIQALRGQASEARRQAEGSRSDALKARDEAADSELRQALDEIHVWSTAQIWRKGATGPGTRKADLRLQAHVIAERAASALGLPAPPEFEE